MLESNNNRDQNFQTSWKVQKIYTAREVLQSLAVTNHWTVNEQKIDPLSWSQKGNLSAFCAHRAYAALPGYPAGGPDFLISTQTDLQLEYRLPFEQSAIRPVPGHYESYSCELFALAITSGRLDWLDCSKKCGNFGTAFGARKIYENCQVPATRSVYP